MGLSHFEIISLKQLSKMAGPCTLNCIETGARPQTTCLSSLWHKTLKPGLFTRLAGKSSDGPGKPAVPEAKADTQAPGSGRCVNTHSSLIEHPLSALATDRATWDPRCPPPGIESVRFPRATSSKYHVMGVKLFFHSKPSICPLPPALQA